MKEAKVGGSSVHNVKGTILVLGGSLDNHSGSFPLSFDTTQYLTSLTAGQTFSFLIVGVFYNQRLFNKLTIDLILKFFIVVRLDHVDQTWLDYFDWPFEEVCQS